MNEFFVKVFRGKALFRHAMLSCNSSYCLLMFFKTARSVTKKCRLWSDLTFCSVWPMCIWGWLGVVKVPCILCHRSVQLILAYSWARLAILVAGKGRGECFHFICFFTFIPIPLSSLSLSSISSTISSVSFLPFSGRRHKMIHKGWCVIKPQHKKNLCVTALFAQVCLSKYLELIQHLML